VRSCSSQATSTRDAVLASVGEGLFVQSVNRPCTRGERGERRLLGRARRAHDPRRQVAEPVREVTVASTLQRMLQSILHIGSDLQWLPRDRSGPDARHRRHATERRLSQLVSLGRGGLAGVAAGSDLGDEPSLLVVASRRRRKSEAPSLLADSFVVLSPPPSRRKDVADRLFAPARYGCRVYVEAAAASARLRESRTPCAAAPRSVGTRRVAGRR